jgi:hypothetical protein
MLDLLQRLLVLLLVPPVLPLQRIVFATVVLQNSFRPDKQLRKRVGFGVILIEGGLVVHEVELGADGGGEVGLLLFVSAHQGLHFEGAVDEVGVVGQFLRLAAGRLVRCRPRTLLLPPRNVVAVGGFYQGFPAFLALLASVQPQSVLVLAALRLS